MDGHATGSALSIPGFRAARKTFAGGDWFFTGIACVMIIVAAAGFAPSIVHVEGRRAPLSPLAAAHGIVFFAWLLLFFIQTRLVASKRVAIHRRVGVAAVAIAAAMLPLGYATCISMVRRGFDLSGDLRAGRDPALLVVFPLGDLVLFSVFVTAAIGYRRHPDMHKRLMLFANIALIAAPLAHLIGHTPLLADLPPPVILVPMFLFMAAAVAREFLTTGKVHPLTWGIAAGMLVSGPLRAAVIGPSTTWHALVQWLAR